jgi:hypothetical protein
VSTKCPEQAAVFAQIDNDVNRAPQNLRQSHSSSFFVTFFRIAPLIRRQMEGRATTTKNDGGSRRK